MKNFSSSPVKVVLVRRVGCYAELVVSVGFTYLLSCLSGVGPMLNQLQPSSEAEAANPQAFSPTCSRYYHCLLSYT